METLMFNEETCGIGLSEFYTLSNVNDNFEHLIDMACCLQTVIQKMNSSKPEFALWAVSAIYNLSFSENTKKVLQQMDECLCGLARASVKDNTQQRVEIDSSK